MKNFNRLRAAFLAGALLVSGCGTSDPTSALLDNAYPAPAAPDSTTQRVVYKAWWSVALFAEPVLAGQESEPLRVVPGTDYAYALLAPDWDPASGSPPTALLPLRTTERVSVERGGTLHIAISDATTLGNCATGTALSAEDAAFIVERVFPGDFAEVSYDAATCTAVPHADGGTDGSSSD